MLAGRAVVLLLLLFILALCNSHPSVAHDGAAATEDSDDDEPDNRNSTATSENTVSTGSPSDPRPSSASSRQSRLGLGREDRQQQRVKCSWIPRTLRNGQVRVKARGTLIRFKCNDGFELIGPRQATCLRSSHGARTTGPQPYCAGRRCRTPSSPSNGRVIVYQRGALAHYFCNPFFALVGSGQGSSSSMLCQGDNRWNGTAPLCQAEPSRADVSLACDFELDYCEWRQDLESLEWRRNRQRTDESSLDQSGQEQFGYQNGTTSSYYYAALAGDAHGRDQLDKGLLYSPLLFSNRSGSCLTLSYRIFDDAAAVEGSLRIYQKAEQATLDQLRPLWSSSAGPNRPWQAAAIPVPAITSRFQIVIIGSVQSHDSALPGLVAIDNIDLQPLSCDQLSSIDRSVAAESNSSSTESWSSSPPSSGQSQGGTGDVAVDKETDGPTDNAAGADCENKCNQSQSSISSGNDYNAAHNNCTCVSSCDNGSCTAAAPTPSPTGQKQQEHNSVWSSSASNRSDYGSPAADNQSQIGPSYDGASSSSRSPRPSILSSSSSASSSASNAQSTITITESSSPLTSSSLSANWSEEPNGTLRITRAGLSEPVTRSPSSKYQTSSIPSRQNNAEPDRLPPATTASSRTSSNSPTVTSTVPDSMSSAAGPTQSITASQQNLAFTSSLEPVTLAAAAASATTSSPRHSTPEINSQPTMTPFSSTAGSASTAIGAARKSTGPSSQGPASTVAYRPSSTQSSQPSASPTTVSAVAAADVSGKQAAAVSRGRPEMEPTLTSVVDNQQQPNTGSPLASTGVVDTSSISWATTPSQVDSSKYLKSNSSQSSTAADIEFVTRTAAPTATRTRAWFQFGSRTAATTTTLPPYQQFKNNLKGKADSATPANANVKSKPDPAIRDKADQSIISDIATNVKNIIIERHESGDDGPLSDKAVSAIGQAQLVLQQRVDGTADRSRANWRIIWTVLAAMGSVTMMGFIGLLSWRKLFRKRRGTGSPDDLDIGLLAFN